MLPSFLERLNICLAEKGKGSGNMVQKHDAFAPGNKWCQNKWCQAPFCKKEDILIQKIENGAWHHLLAPFIPKASLSSPSERNHARSAFLTVFLPYSLRQAGKAGKKSSLSLFYMIHL
jgi:hypothetical protein